MNELLTINKMVYNPPMTIAIWSDGTKTMARCEDGDAYSKELGFALCVMKKKYGNKKVRAMFDRYVYAEGKKNGNSEVIKKPTVKVKRPTFKTTYVPDNNPTTYQTTILPHTGYIINSQIFNDDLVKETLKVLGLI